MGVCCAVAHVCTDAGVPLQHNGIQKQCKEQLLATALHYQGVTHRDCHDDAQLAEHVIGLTRALAEQPYKVSAPAAGRL